MTLQYLIPELWSMLIGLLILIITRINIRNYNTDLSVNKKFVITLLTLFFLPLYFFIKKLFFIKNNFNFNDFDLDINLDNITFDFDELYTLLLLQSLLLIVITYILKQYNLLYSKIVYENFSLIIFIFITLNLILKVDSILLLLIILECHNILLIGLSLVRKNSLISIDGAIKYFYLAAFTTIFFLLALYTYMEFYRVG